MEIPAFAGMTHKQKTDFESPFFLLLREGDACLLRRSSAQAPAGMTSAKVSRGPYYFCEQQAPRINEARLTPLASAAALGHKIMQA
jgi:hypothetical protein